MEYANYIAHCVEIARRGEYYVAPNPMVGAVLVRNSDGKILAEGWHEQYGGPHAEVNCFRNAEKTLNSQFSTLNSQFSILNSQFYKDCTLYVSLEPCSHYGKTPPCARMIIEKGVGRVVVGMRDPNPLVAGNGIRMLREAGIEVVEGVLEQECRELNKRFLCLHEKHRPYVILKWAQTADGFIDGQRDNEQCTKGEHLQGALTISTPATKALVHKMRAENMAIMVGTGTVLADNPRLLTTHWEGRNPIRVTMDRHNRIPHDANIFTTPNSQFSTLNSQFYYPGIDPVIVYRDRTDWAFVLSDLAGRGIHSVLVEGGRRLLEHILATGVWDEIHVEVAPELTIGTGVPAPKITLPEEYEPVDGHRMYTIKN